MLDGAMDNKGRLALNTYALNAFVSKLIKEKITITRRHRQKYNNSRRLECPSLSSGQIQNR